ncbi:M20 family metallopeptidase [Phycisphaerales bacterium AB-hyl4]|uniref:M20 family metallopeptidase n=1 Tax=Natronomicrosphaera hydrolytica TaxID=3242702 RepID=A0ABV4U725_9BACT
MSTPHLPENVEQLLQTMVQHDTVNAAASHRPQPEQPLVKYLEWLARQWGLTTRRLPMPHANQADNLLITYIADDDRPWLLFDNHMDTVSVAGMTIDPFSGEIRDGKLFGRGACDTKGTGAAALWALRQYAQSTDQPHNVALLFSVDEEVGMTGIQHFLDHHLPRLGFTPRGVIVGEPTELHPVPAHNGTLRFKLLAHGKAAHSSVPHEGRSAITMMVRAVDAIEQNYINPLTNNPENEHLLTGRAACSINVIRGGSATNIIPDACEVEIDRRLLPGENHADIVDTFLQIANSVTLPGDTNYLDNLPDPPFTTSPLVYHPPLPDTHNGDLLAMSKAVLKQMGLPTFHLGAPFGTHAGFISQANLPAIVLGPGNVAVAHQASEWIELDQLHKGVTLYQGLMACDA